MTTTAVAELRRRHTEIRGRLRAINDAHTDGNLGDDGAEWTRLDGEVGNIEAAITRQERLDDLERRAVATPLHGSGDAAFDRLAERVTIVDVIRAQISEFRDDRQSGVAREISREIERRTGRPAHGLYFDMRMSTPRPEQRVFTTTLPGGGPGSNLIQTDVAPYLIDRLRERTIVRRLGATVLSGLQGNLEIPRLTASTTAYWVAENSAITASDPQVDQVGLTPKHVGALTELSRNMLMQPSIDVTRMVEDDMARVIAVGLDRVALVGGGSGEPSGLLASGSGIGAGTSLGATGGAPTWDAVVALIASVDTANALAGSLAFATNAKVVSKLRRTLKTSTDSASNFIMTDAATLAGYPLASTQLVPSNLTKSTGNNLSATIFGDWSMLVLAFWAELDLLVNPYESTAYSKGNVQVRAMATADVAIRQPLAFAANLDIATT
jgi:HK97 family phage major capsid protein